jgi:hypothetical protein
MADGKVVVAPDSTGKVIDNTELIREPVLGSDGTVLTAALTVERQRVILSSDENPRIQVGVEGDVGRGALAVGGGQLGVLHSIDLSLKMLCVMLSLALEQDLDSVREIVFLNET